MYIIIFIIILFIWVFLIFKYTKANKLSSENVKLFNIQLKRLIENWSFKEQIIDMDKLYHKILQEIGYTWTFWEILKIEPSEIVNIQRIWELHKLRNKLVHDFDNLSQNVLQNKSLDYEKEIKRLIKKVT